MPDAQSIKAEIAKKSAKLFLTQMASVPTDVQLMAIAMLASTVFSTGVKPEHQLQLIDPWLKSIRDQVIPKKKTRK